MDNNLKESYLENNLQEICRTCLAKTNNLQTIFSIVDLLEECTSIQINMEDDFPKLICIECTNKLNSAHLFRKQCEESHKTLLQLSQFRKVSFQLESNHSQLQNVKTENVEFNQVLIKMEPEIEITTTEVNTFQNISDTHYENTQYNLELANAHELNDTINCENRNISDDSNAQNIKLESKNINLSADYLTCDFDNQPMQNTIKIENEESILEEHDYDIPIRNVSESVDEIKCNKKSNKISAQRKKEVKKDEIEIKNGRSCPTCKKSFELESDLEIHMLKHQKFVEYICPKCSKSFVNVTKLKRHISTHLINKPHKCHVCNKSFNEVCNRDRHLLVHKNDDNCQNNDDAESLKKNYSCTQCGKLFELENDLEIHKLKHQKFSEYICNICSKSYESEAGLKLHLSRHMVHKPYKCNFCSKSFVKGDDRNRHLLKHTGEKPHECSLCGKRFMESRHLSRHMKYHLGIKNFSCTVCSKSFVFHHELRRHMRVHTGEKSYLCMECGKSFRGSQSYKDHVVSHSGERQYSCKECDRTFVYKVSLKRHMLSHTSETPHVCNVCGVGYAQARSLVTHRRIHAGVKPYSCNTCDEAFITSQELHKHKRIHNEPTTLKQLSIEEDKPYFCDICGKNFSLNKYLSQHKRDVHIDGTPFACEICGKTFKTNRILAQHKRNKHTYEGKPFACDACEKTFQTKRLLYLHKRNKHKDDKEAVLVRNSNIDTIKDEENI